MHTYVKRALLGVLIGGGITLFGSVAAQAAETSGDDGIGSGTQALISVDLPVTVSGNAISVIGDSSSTHSHASTTAPAQHASAKHSKAKHTKAKTSGKHSIVGGTQGVITVKAPVTVAGNAVSAIGESRSTGSTAGRTDAAPSAPASGSSSTGSGGAATTSGDHSILGGTQLIAPVTAPITVAGNAVSVIGDASSTGSTVTGGTPVGTPPSTDPGSGTVPGDPTTPVGTGGDVPTGTGDSGGTQVMAMAASVGQGSALASTGGGTGMAGLWLALGLLCGGALLIARRGETVMRS